MSRRLLVAYGFLLFVLVVLRTAWVSDYAYLALRTADNAAWGMGFRWNAAERVQVFGQPLWMLGLYLARMATGEVYYGTLVLSIVCALAAAWLVLRQATSDTGVLAAALLLALSPTFVTYSTSGLGTPLVHLLIVAFAVQMLREPTRGSGLSLLATLAALTDPATLLITLKRGQSPFSRRSAKTGAIAASTIGTRSRFSGFRPSFARWHDKWGLSPFWGVGLWGAVSISYYGSIVPAGTMARWHQVSAGDRASAGVQFLLDISRRDPLLTATMAAGLALPFLRPTRERPLAAGALLYTIAIVATGGSTWAGYGLTVPFVLAVLIVARQPELAAPRVAAGALATIALLAIVTPVHTFASHAQYGRGSTGQSGIIDPRQQDYQATGLLLVRRNQWFPDHPESVRGLRAGERHDPIGSSPRPGFFGFAAGRSVYVLDRTGVGDPLLARLPPATAIPPGRSPLELRARAVPEGYVESLVANRNLIADPNLRQLYERVRFVTRSPLGQDGRLENALLLAFGLESR